jgi:uncharacterized membrane protein
MGLFSRAPVETPGNSRRAVDRLTAAAERTLEGTRPALERVEELASTAANKAAMLAGPAVTWLGEKGTTARQSSGKALRDSKDYVARNPVKVVILGLAAGYLLKKLVFDRRARTEGNLANAQRSIDVKVPVHTAYNQWTQFEDFPRFMDGVLEVRQLDDTHLHWRARVAGKEKEWDAVITEQVPDERIAWTNTSGARNAGVVTFHRLDPTTTRIMLQLDYAPEGVLESSGSALGLVERQIHSALTRFKDFIESRGTETGAWRGEVRQSH